jgi:Na+-transporting NADH:ubiquinone oxidoreductase subunit A
MINLKFKKGFDLPLQGEAEELITSPAYPEKVAIKPVEFLGLKPKLEVEIGDKVKIGSPLCYDKNNSKLKLTSPASGEVREIIRGERRVIEAIVIKTDGEKQAKSLGISKKDISNYTREEIISSLLKSGLFPAFKQRPFAKIANPEDTPRDIFISAIPTSPLSPNSDYLVDGNDDAFQAGLDIISKITTGKVYLAINGKKDVKSSIAEAKSVEIVKVSGPHPSGNVGIHIHHIAPIKNRNDIVWTCNVQAVIWIGKLFIERKLNPETTIAVAGSSAKGRAYFKTIMGASLKSFVSKKTPINLTRFISGDVLTGKQTGHNGFAGFYDNLITIIPEPGPEHYDFLGWTLPGFNKISRSMTYLSNYIRLGVKFEQRASLNGGRRAFIATGIFEEVLPMDIYPIFLLKSIIAGDIEEMEGLGIYEVAEEDFALCEYIDPSKNSIQDILRDGLDLIYKEG